MNQRKRNLQNFLDEMGCDTLLEAMFKKIETNAHVHNSNSQKELS